MRYALYAARGYLEQHGLPDAADGFSGHRLVLLDSAAGEVAHEAGLTQTAHRAQIALRANGLRAHLAAVRSGAALAMLPGLQRLPQAEPVRAVRVGLHADMREPPRIRALLDFLVIEFQRLESRLNPAD